jgi:hypothetical protein
MDALRNLRRAGAALLLVLSLPLAARGAPGAPGQEDEHPFIMPGTPPKTVPSLSPWLTGAQLLRRLEQGDAGAVEYVKGVFDATESGLWCYTDYKRRPTPKQSPEAMRRQAVEFLRRLSPLRLKERGAALVIEMWQTKWPCPPDGCCPGSRGM